MFLFLFFISYLIPFSFGKFVVCLFAVDLFAFLPSYQNCTIYFYDIYIHVPFLFINYLFVSIVYGRLPRPLFFSNASRDRYQSVKTVIVTSGSNNGLGSQTD